MSVPMRTMSLEEARAIATRAVDLLSGINGDPQRQGSWIRERRLAEIVLALIDRVEAATASVEVRS